MIVSMTLYVTGRTNHAKLATWRYYSIVKVGTAPSYNYGWMGALQQFVV